MPIEPGIPNTMLQLVEMFDDEKEWAAAREAAPQSFGQLLTNLLLAAGDDPLIYLDTKIEYDRLSATADVVLFTESLLIRASATLPERDDLPAKIEVVATRRRGLVSVSPRASISALTTDQTKRWPGLKTIDIEYESGPKVTYPLNGLLGTSAKGSRLLNLLASLRRELISS